MELDYQKLGFKAGLEIHQQLDTGKLFCKCPGFLRNDSPDLIVKRKLHKVAGETGEVDVAAEYEASLDKEFIYQYYKNTNCLVELDEEPPHLINEKALDEALKIALLLNCEIYQTTQIMRKMVIDGSNTSGFQRTLLLAHSGFVETSFGKVPIDTICLEEDAARIIERKEKQVIYRLDRAGIPLIEIATSPVINKPEQIKETALKIGEILRACKVKRGIGSIRQDINISIKAHERVEIKGFQEPSMMSITAEKEILRQMQEIEKEKTAGEVRNALPNGETEFLRPMPGKARMYPETDLPLLKISREKINSLKKNLPKLKHEIRNELKKKGLNEELINLVLDSNAVDELETLSKLWKEVNLIAKMLCLWPSEFASKMKKSYEEIREILNERTLEKVLEALSNGNISEGDVKPILFKITEGSGVEDALKIDKKDDNLLEEEIRKIVNEKPGLRANAYMGLVIQKLGKDIDKRKAMEILNKLVE